MAYPSQNRHRQPPRTKSGLRGVIFHRHCPERPWKAYGRQQGEYVTLGYFATKEEAALAYNTWAVKLKGPDTYLNPL